MKALIWDARSRMVIHASVLVVLVTVKVACIWLSGKMLNCVYCLQPAFVWTSTKNVWNARNAVWSRAFGPSIARTDHACFDFPTRKAYANHTSTVMEQKRFDLRSLSPALRNLWLLLSLLVSKEGKKLPFNTIVVEILYISIVVICVLFVHKIIYIWLDLQKHGYRVSLIYFLSQSCSGACFFCFCFVLFLFLYIYFFHLLFIYLICTEYLLNRLAINLTLPPPQKKVSHNFP